MTEPNMEWEKEFVEKGAELEHDRWARWQKYMFSKGVVDENGVFHLPEEFTDRWFRQIDTPYSELSEAEKESDRKETRNYLSLIRQAISQAEQRGYEKGVAEDREQMVIAVEEIKKNISEMNDDSYINAKVDACNTFLSLLHHNK